MSIGRPKKYVKDYQVIEEPRKNGKGVKKRTVYCGKYYRFDMTDEAYKGLLIIFGTLAAAWVIGIVAGLLFIKAASLGNAGTNAQFYVLLPYVFQLFPAVVVAGKVVMLALSPRYMERFQYDDLVLHLRKWLVVGIAIASATFVGVIAALVLGVEKDTTLWAAALLVLEALIALCCWFFIRVFDRYQCVQTDVQT